MIDRNTTLAALLSTRHAELPLFLLRMQNTHAFEGFATDRGEELFRDHLLYWWELEENGQLFGAGPVDFGSPDQEGLAIVMATDLTSAQSIAASEPLHAASWRINTVRRWQLNEGLVIAAAKGWLESLKNSSTLSAGPTG